MSNTLFDVLGKGILVSQYKDEWEFRCPKCKEEKHLHVSMLKGVYVCVSPGCGFRGKLSDLAPDIKILEHKQEKISLNEDLMLNVYSKMAEAGELRVSHEQWLLKRGLYLNKKTITLVSSDGLIEKLQETFSNSDLFNAGLMKKSHRLFKPSTVVQPGRIVILYNDPYSLKFHYARSRSIYPEAIKYASPSGVPGTHVSWGWQNIKNTNWLVVTEGEFKAQAACQVGIPCIGLPGMQSGHKAFVQACKHYGIEYVCILFDSETDYCNNTPKQQVIDAAAMSLSKQIKSAGIAAYMGRLPIIDNSKTDIDSFLLYHGPSGKHKLKKIIYSSERL